MKIIKGDASLILLALIIVILLLGIVFSAVTFRSNPVMDALASNRLLNVLYVIEENKMPVSAYVLMYYSATKRAAIFDIPGDIGLLLPKINRYDRIDRLYEPNRLSSYQNEIEKLLGIEINFSIIITKENLVSVIDLLEGVEIFIPSPVSYRDENGIVLFPSGMTILDGDKASLYATYSLPDEESDMKSFRRQRFFLSFLNRQIERNEYLKNPDAAKLYYSLFKTGMNQRTLAYLYDEFVNINTERTYIYSVSGTLRQVSGQTLIFPHYDGALIKDIVRQTLGSLTRDVEDERTFTVEVLNGTAINGLAGRTADIIRGFGYDVISVKNADRNDYSETVITHFSGDANMVREFAEIIRCRNIRSEFITPDEIEENMLNQSSENRADVTLLIGRDFDGRYVTGN